MTRNCPQQSPSEYRTINPMKAKYNVKLRLRSMLYNKRSSQASPVYPDCSGNVYALHNSLMSSVALTMQTNKFGIKYCLQQQSMQYGHYEGTFEHRQSLV